MRIDVRIGGQFTCNGIGQISHVTAVRGAQVALHGSVVGKRGGGGANFSTHITDGTFTGTGKGGSPFAEVLDNSSRSTLHRQDACHLEDHVLGRSPAVEFAGQLHTDEFRKFQFPGHAGHYVNGIRTAYTDGHHAQTAGVHRVRVRTDHHTSREGVVFQNHLVDNTCTGLPEANAVFVGDRSQEVEDLVALVNRILQIRRSAYPSLDQVIAVRGGRNSYFFAARLHELKQGHLSRGILHGHAVRCKVHIGSAALVGFGRVALPKVGVQNLFREGQRMSDHSACRSYTPRKALIEAADHFNIKCHTLGI